MTAQFSLHTFAKCATVILLYLTSIDANAQQPFTMSPVKGLVGTATPPKSAWLNYKNTAGAFRLRVPGDVALNTKEVPNSAYTDFPATKLYIYTVSDTVAMKGYLFRYNDFPNGMYLSNKEATFAGVIKDFESKGKVVKEPSVIFKDGVEGRVLDLVVDKFYMQVQIFVRGNRQYLLLKQNLNGATAASEDEFFDSFHFEPYELPKVSPFTIGNIEVNVPEKPLLIPDDDTEASVITDSKVYYSTNRNTGGLYGIEHGKMSKYYKIEHVDSLYTKMLANINTEDDSVYKNIAVKIAGATGREQLTINKPSGNHKRTKVWISGDDFYYQTLNSTQDEISSPQADHYFNAINQTKLSPFDLKSSKIELLLKDLKSQDTTIHKQAMGAFSYYVFDKTELPAMYAAIKNTYADDSDYNGARKRLMDAVVTLKDQQTVPAFKAIFEDQKNQDEIRGQALARIPEVDKGSYDWYLNALTKTQPLKVAKPYRLFTPLSDSLKYASDHFDQLLPVFDVDHYRPALLSIASQMVFSKDKEKYKSLLKANGTKLEAKAMSDLDQFIKENVQHLEPSVAPMYDYLNLLPLSGPSKLTDEFTTRLLGVDSIVYLKNAAVVSRIKAGLPVDKQQLNAQLDSLNMRYDVLYALSGAGKLATIPAKYKTPVEFAKLLLYNSIIADYDPPQSIELLGSILEGKSTYYVFSMSYTEEGVKKVYLGIGGGGTEKPGVLDFENAIGYSNYETVEKDWMAQAKKLIAELKADK